MLTQVRKAKNNIEHDKIFQAIVEIAETYIGGKPGKSNRKDDDDMLNKWGQGTKKNPVLGIVDREKKDKKNISELSEYIGSGISTIYSWVSQRRIPFLKCERLTKFDLLEIDNWTKESSAKEKKTRLRLNENNLINTDFQVI